MNAFAIILAGGNGERFWPLSTSDCPKQFLDIFGAKPLIRHAVDRLTGLIPAERVFIITADRLVARTRESLPNVPADNILGEPCRRDTAAAVATACGLVMKKGGEDAVGCILTADQLMEPVERFQQVVRDAIQMAAASDAIVTIGIAPTRPETGFGYIACGEEIPEAPATTPFHAVARFVEKPDAETAARYLAAGNYLWNSGMFIWKASVMRAAFRASASDIAPLIDAVAASTDVSSVLAACYPPLRAISVDFAVMEHAPRIFVARSAFTWDDVGSWGAVEHHFPADAQGNVVLGTAVLQNVSGATVVNRAENGHVVAVAGLKDVVVVQTSTATLVCSKSEAANLKSLVRSLPQI